MQESAKKITLPIFLTVLIDMLGVGVIIPVLPALFFEGESPLIGSQISSEMVSLFYGALIATYPLMQFFGAPILGALSDRFGRKPMLTISLIGTFIGYLIFGYGVVQQNIFLLFVGRALPGFTGGNISIVYSAFSDVSKGPELTKNFGLVGAAFAIGFILGPVLGGLLADNTLVSWFSLATPFWFTAIITLINIIFLRFLFPETLKEKTKATVSIFQGFKNIGTSFRAPNLRNIFSVVLLTSLGFSFYTQFFSAYLYEVFDFTLKDVAILYGWIGFWLAFTQGFLVRKMSAFFLPTTILNYSLLCLAVSLAFVLVPSYSWWFFLINPLIAIAYGTNSPNLSTIVSDQARPDQKGGIMGINQSMNSLGQVTTSITGGFLIGIDPGLPILVGVAMVFFAWLVYRFIFSKGSASA